MSLYMNNSAVPDQEKQNHSRMLPRPWRGVSKVLIQPDIGYLYWLISLFFAIIWSVGNLLYLYLSNSMFFTLLHESQTEKVNN